MSSRSDLPITPSGAFASLSPLQDYDRLIEETEKAIARVVRNRAKGIVDASECKRLTRMHKRSIRNMKAAKTRMIKKMKRKLLG